MPSALQNKVSLHKIYFSSGLHYKSKFCQNSSLPLYALTLGDWKTKISLLQQ